MTSRTGGLVNRTAEERWTEHRDGLLQELVAAAEIVIRIPGWDPVGLDEGLRWLQSTHYEGFKVGHQIEWAGRRATVAFDPWEEWGG